MHRTNCFHAPGLHMHQPPGSLRLLVETNPREAEQIIRWYKRPVRHALGYPDVARLQVGVSGVLLKHLLDPAIIDLYQHILDVPEMLARYGEAENIELFAMGYYRPVLPLFPRADWAEKLQGGRAMLECVVGRATSGMSRMAEAGRETRVRPIPPRFRVAETGR